MINSFLSRKTIEKKPSDNKTMKSGKIQTRVTNSMPTPYTDNNKNQLRQKENHKYLFYIIHSITKQIFKLRYVNLS